MNLVTERANRALKRDMADAEAVLTGLAKVRAGRRKVAGELKLLRARRQSIRKKTEVNWDVHVLWMRQPGPGIHPTPMVLYALAFDSRNRLIGWGRDRGSPAGHRRKVFAVDRKAERAVEYELTAQLRR